MKIDKFRIQRSLGTQIDSISDISEDGYTIKYVEGDYCNQELGLKFESVIRYVCNQTEEYGKPELEQYSGDFNKYSS